MAAGGQAHSPGLVEVGVPAGPSVSGSSCPFLLWWVRGLALFPISLSWGMWSSTGEDLLSQPYKEVLQLRSWELAPAAMVVPRGTDPGAPLLMLIPSSLGWLSLQKSPLSMPPQQKSLPCRCASHTMWLTFSTASALLHFFPVT